MRRLRLLPLVLLSLLWGCPEAEGPAPLDPTHFTDVECFGEGEVRCSGAMHQTCRSGLWYDEDYCADGLVCSYQLGCTACDPFVGAICQGDNVYSCTTDGQLGSVIDACGPGQCDRNHCVSDDCPPGTDLIYVVDSSYRLLSFDPGDDLHVFSLRGNLNCAAGAVLPGWGGMSAGATPFSMSVDRTGRAWVLYSSGEIFWTNVRNPESCTLSPWQAGTEGFELFGMGFASVAPDSGAEELFVAGGTATQLATHATGRLGVIEPEGMDFSVKGSLSPSEYGPELTGTGEGELFGYFPGLASTKVALLDKTTGANALEWLLPALPGQLRAWAFAHWGGRFYIFISFIDPIEGQLSQVHRFDPATGESEVVLDDIPYVIVGAGVSTCAPTVVD